MGAMSEAAVRWFEGRGIDPETAARCGVYTQRQEPTGDDVIVFPFLESGQAVNEKFRARGKRFWQREGGKKTFWNYDALLDPALVTGASQLVITEGEIDCLTALDSGFTAVSVPDGAPQKLGEGEIDPRDDKKFEYVWNCWDALAKVKRIVLATDGDEPGKVLAQELVRRLGVERCSFVEYPDGCKDLNEVLLKAGGVAAVARVLNAAKPYPVRGLYELRDFPDVPEPVAYSTGWQQFDDHFKPVLGGFFVVTGVPGHGKALAHDTKIPTPAGWTTMGAICVGQTVFDEAGRPCRVVRVSDVMEGRPCYRVRFSDGAEIVADAEHQWLTRSDRARRSANSARIKRGDRAETRPRGNDQRRLRTYPSVVTTEQISATLTVEGGKRRNHSVAVAGALDTPAANLPIDPYVLGAWLGDGTSANGSITCADVPILAFIERAGYAVSAQATPLRFTILGLQPALRALQVLANKHIPAEYMRASREQRMALLQGLMDTDGCVTGYGRCEFTQSNEALARQVYELCGSLGFRARLISGRATLYGRDCGIKWRVTFTPSERVFRLPRKAEQIDLRPSERRAWRYIEAVEPVESVPVRCIEVDSPSHLFLVSEAFIPTHNSTFVSALACNLAEIHDWRICVASFEMPPVPYHRNLLRQYRLGKHANWSSAIERTEADDWIADHFKFISQMPGDDDQDLGIDEILDLAGAAVVRHGIKALVIDPWNEVEHKRRRDETETDYIGRGIRAIKRFARRYEVAVFVVAHPVKLGGQGKGIVKPNLYDISGSSNWYNKCDAGIVVWREDVSSSEVEITVLKPRFRTIGKPGIVRMRLNEGTGRFTESQDEVGAA